MRALLAILFCCGAIAAMAQAGGPVTALMDRLETPAVRSNAWLPEAPPPGEIVAAGHAVAMGGASRNGAQFACFTCHGGNGEGDSAGAVPRLAGLPAYYLNAQLRNYASGERSNDIMSPIARALGTDEMRAVSTYYATLPSVSAMDGLQLDRDVLQHGARLSAIGSDEAKIPACANCHGPYGTGMAPSVPPLAGQGRAYMERRLADWRRMEPARHPSNPMVSIAAKMSDRDIAAASAFFELLAPKVAPGAVTAVRDD